MSLRDLINKELSKWMLAPGPESDVVISSRVRLARNITGIPFPNRATPEQAKQVYNQVQKALEDRTAFNLKLVDLSRLSEIERTAMMEKHLISPMHAEGGQYKGVAFSEDEVISVMINEEDHIRAQVLYPGFQVEEAYRVVNQLDNFLESKLDFAFSEKYGYLTACPTNVGTGMRASVMVHLPGLNLANRIQQMLQGVSKLGLTVRGVFGEGTEAQGNLYQISNQVTLGRTEEEIIDNLNRVTEKIIENERYWRQQLLKERKDDLTDRIMRSYGLLMYAHKMSSEEAVRLLSDVRLGIDLGIIKNVEPNVFSELIVLTRPGYLQKIENKTLKPEERDIRRAALIRKRLRLTQS
ncbi:protein arginine kinase [Anoxybacter fermentans]|uniref:Protein-arginine kinase n=1 Tax=Anoxybacter fermentans TaxID=1323375 RepID=A0A3S9T2B7_9FIRM|nr:protein arginine kinase [Anoxybacter fermentans]AZR74684.1 protein arginine kinase [Anoxybacter fermentans]